MQRPKKLQMLSFIILNEQSIYPKSNPEFMGLVSIFRQGKDRIVTDMCNILNSLRPVWENPDARQINELLNYIWIEEDIKISIETSIPWNNKPVINVHLEPDMSYVISYDSRYCSLIYTESDIAA